MGGNACLVWTSATPGTAQPSVFAHEEGVLLTSREQPNEMLESWKVLDGVAETLLRGAGYATPKCAAFAYGLF